MAKQISFEDIIPNEFKLKVVSFASEAYRTRQDNGELPQIKNQHEGYGVQAEAYVAVKNAFDAVKTSINDVLSALPASNIAFGEATDNVYGACVSLAQAAVNMAIHAQNISWQWRDLVDTSRPLIDGTGEDVEGEEIPDFEIETEPENDAENEEDAEDE